MPSSKGEPTDPELREKIKNKIQSDSPGGWAAWKAAKLAKEYEAQGGGYKSTADSTNKPKKGTPEPKAGVDKASGGAAQTKKREKKDSEAKQDGGNDSKPKSTGNKRKKDKEGEDKKEESKGTATAANGDGTSAKKAKKDESAVKPKAAPKKKTEKKPATQGERKQPSRGVKK